jgi:hypothetical protein
VNNARTLVNIDGSRFAVSADAEFETAYTALRLWLGTTSANMSQQLSVQLALASLNLAFGTQAGNSSVADVVAGDTIPVTTLLARVSTFVAEHPNTTAASANRVAADRYRLLLAELNANRAMVNPASPESCPAPA